MLEGGGLEKVPILKQLLHFSGQSDGGECAERGRKVSPRMADF